MNGSRRVIGRLFERLGLLLLPLFIWVTNVRAEDISAGDRVRVQYAEGLIVGDVVSTDDRYIDIQTATGSKTHVEKSSITRLELLGKERHLGMGMLIGAGFGAVVGVVAAATEHRDPDDLIYINVDGFVIGACTVLGAAAGALIGGLTQTDKWTEVPIDDKVRVGVAPMNRDGVALSLAWSF